MNLCLIEDDAELGAAVCAALSDADHRVVWVRRVQQARAALDDDALDGVVLDLGLPDGNGFEVLRDLRARRKQIPVVVITARDALADRIRGLDLGADDYLVKPFEAAELLARLRAVARRAAGAAAAWQVRDLTIDEQRHEVTRAGECIALSKSEFALLRTLARHSGRVLTRIELESRALPDNEGAALDVHLSNLRRKIGPGYIRTIRGVGYVIER
ncbi:MAG: response regulator transcription factor [Pseudomonadota bacterium]|nr:response regulator transcription factor [Pseudomonadota bacterium]